MTLTKFVLLLGQSDNLSPFTKELHVQSLVVLFPALQSLENKTELQMECLIVCLKETMTKKLICRLGEKRFEKVGQPW